MSERNSINWTPVLVVIALVAGLALVKWFDLWPNSDDSNNAQPQVVVIDSGSSTGSSDGNLGTNTNNGDSSATTSNGDGTCGVIHEYEISPSLPEVSTRPTAGRFIHVQFWTPGEPEREYVLDPGRYAISEPDGEVLGFVWEYGEDCSRDQVEAQMMLSIENRRLNNANNDGVASVSLVQRYFNKIGPS